MVFFDAEASDFVWVEAKDVDAWFFVVVHHLVFDFGCG